MRCPKPPTPAHTAPQRRTLVARRQRPRTTLSPPPRVTTWRTPAPRQHQRRRPPWRPRRRPSPPLLHSRRQRMSSGSSAQAQQRQRRQPRHHRLLLVPRPTMAIRLQPWGQSHPQHRRCRLWAGSSSRTPPRPRHNHHHPRRNSRRCTSARQGVTTSSAALTALHPDLRRLHRQLHRQWLWLWLPTLHAQLARLEMTGVGLMVLRHPYSRLEPRRLPNRRLTVRTRGEGLTLLWLRHQHRQHRRCQWMPRHRHLRPHTIMQLLVHQHRHRHRKHRCQHQHQRQRQHQAPSLIHHPQGRVLFLGLRLAVLLTSCHP